MDTFDGVLLVPPERGQILGRAVWKARYVCIGPRSATLKDGPVQAVQRQVAANRQNGNGNRSLAKSHTDELCIAVYKVKEDYEPIQIWPASCISDCQVQSVAHRKQGPALPTLVITMSDKDRKRRSSRAAGLISTNKESGATTLWFRAPPDENHQILQEWAKFILSRKQAAASPMSPVFTSPFPSRPREASESFSRPEGIQIEPRQLHHKSSTATYSTGPRDRTITFSSESPSLRSKRSDLSSPTSVHHPGSKYGIVPGQHYTTVRPTDLGPTDEYREGYSEGWSSVQDRSIVSSPTHGRGSVSSQAQQPQQHDEDDVNSPPAPGETILDRAFKFGRITYAESIVPGQEKLSSIARFDALMREADDKRKQREAAQQANQMALRSAFDADDSSEESQDDDSDDSSIAPDYVPEQDEQVKTPLISPTAQRALAFIASRHDLTERPSVSRNHLSFHADSAGQITHNPPSRPHTAHSKSRPSAGTRAMSTPYLVPAATSVDLTTIVNKNTDDVVRRPNAEKRMSDSSAKGLSFSELTKRLSSSSSLLLVQTNASGGSSRRSSEIDVQNPVAQRSAASARGLGPQPPPRNHSRDKCGWRGSVGVVEGGFL